jgi:acetyl-CoA carboxylase carboxyltransferase component
LQQIKKLLGFLPDNCLEDPPVISPKPPLKQLSDDIIPGNRRHAYDVTDVVKGIVDNSDFMQVHEHFAKNIVVGFARINGKPVGIVANQPRFLAGVLDVNASDKAARFIRFCDCFRIPLLTFVDTPGYLPGVDQEHAGVIRHGAKLLYSFSEATVPKVTVIMRKAYGGAYIAMCSRHLGASSVIAWPSAEIAVMGAEGAASIVFRKEISSSSDPDATRLEKVREYEDKFANPYVAASKGYVDIIIEPRKTRETVIKAFEFAGEQNHGNSFRRHGNIPL